MRLKIVVDTRDDLSSDSTVLRVTALDVQACRDVMHLTLVPASASALTLANEVQHAVSAALFRLTKDHVAAGMTPAPDKARGERAGVVMMTAGELRAAIAGLADDDEVRVLDTASGVDLTLVSVEGNMLEVDLTEPAESDPATTA